MTGKGLRIQQVGPGKGYGDQQSCLQALCARLRNKISTDQYRNLGKRSWKLLKLGKKERWRIGLQILFPGPRNCTLGFALAGKRVLTPKLLTGLVEWNSPNSSKNGSNYQKNTKYQALAKLRCFSWDTPWKQITVWIWFKWQTYFLNECQRRLDDFYAK